MSEQKNLQSFIDINISLGLGEELMDYLLILRYIADYCNEEYILNPGVATEKRFTFDLVLYGGFIRDIIAGKKHFNDMDLFINTTNDIIFSDSKWYFVIEKIKRYLTEKLPAHFTVKDIVRPRRVHMPCIDSHYGHYKFIIEKMSFYGNIVEYNFDITANISTDEYNNVLFGNEFSYCDYSVNNLMTHVGMQNMFSELMIRCPHILHFWSETPSTVSDIIKDIKSRNAVVYNIKEIKSNTLSKISRLLSDNQIIEAKEKDIIINKQRKEKLISNGYKIIMMRI